MACFRGHIIRLEVVRAELRRIETMSAGLKRIGRIGVRLSKVCSVDDGVWLLVSRGSGMGGRGYAGIPHGTLEYGLEY